jgi:hypothetical protein
MWVLSLLGAMHRHAHHHSGGSVFLSQYLDAWRHREDLARISRETPNFVPMLNFISPSSWGKPDLLRDEILRNSGPAFKDVPAGALRWLRKAPAETLGILHWCYKSRANSGSGASFSACSMPKVIEVLAGLKPPAPLPLDLQWVVLPRICHLVGSLEALWAEKAVLVKRLAGLLTRHIWNVWTGGYRRLTDPRRPSWTPDYIALWYHGDVSGDRGLTEILDWFRAEGHPRGLPDKNSTWLSLQSRADKWHAEVWRREMEAWEHLVWESLLGAAVMDGITVKPLVTGLDLYEEGRRMRHCVSSYARKCHMEGYRIFSLIEPEGWRSTLGLRPGDGGYVIDQHKGPGNGPVSPAAARAAREVCRLYNIKYLGGPETARDRAGAYGDEIQV